MQPAIRRCTAAVAVVSTLLSISLASAADGGNGVTIVAAPEGGQPAVARLDARGKIHLALNTADGPRYASSTDHGRTFAASLPVVDAASRKPGLKYDVNDLAVGTDGRVHMAMSTNAWKLKLPQNEWGFFYARLEPGAKEFSPVRNINNKPSEGFSLAADDKGRVTACWLSGKLYANVSQDDGRSFGPNVELHAEYDPCNCCTTSAAYGVDGRLAILYREETNDERDMHLILWDQARNEMTRTPISRLPWKIDTCPMTYYSIVQTPGGFTAVWPTKEQIYFARLDRDGNVLSPGEIKTPGRSGHRTGMLALTAPDGGTLVAWTKDKQLGWQRYDARGRAVGSPDAVNTSGAAVAGVVTGEGQFILFR